MLRSEPSSRAALMGEQPTPWDLLQPQDATSRHRTLPRIPAGVDYIFTLLFLEKSEGPASDSGHRVIPLCMEPTRYLTVRCGRTDQSLRGQTLCLKEKSTSHGVVHISMSTR